ncbi:MAG: hypothetical protein E7L00_05745 [Propionibacteriaceae bacterium]|nr:hypothetical protein [Propionibacteriaceae bacterium]
MILLRCVEVILQSAVAVDRPGARWLDAAAPTPPPPLLPELPELLAESEPVSMLGLDSS